MERGYVKLWRKTLDSGILQHPTAWQVFGYLLLMANSKPHRRIIAGVMTEAKPGEVITGRERLAEELGLSVQQIRTALNLLKKLEIVTIKSTNKYSVISLVNWDRYQQHEPAGQPASPPAGQPAPNQHLTTEQEVKNITHTPESKDSSVCVAQAGRKNSSSSDVLAGKRKRLEGKRKQTFEEFWETFGYKKGKAEAIDAWAAIPALTDALMSQILSAAKREAERRPETIAAGRTPIYAQGWITGRRWEDEELAEAPRRRPEYLTNPNFGR